MFLVKKNLEREREKERERERERRTSIGIRSKDAAQITGRLESLKVGAS